VCATRSLGIHRIVVLLLLAGPYAHRAFGAIDLPAAGVNAVGYSYWGTALPFVDVAHMGNQWLTPQAIELTSSGYPAALPPSDVAQTLIFTHNGGIYPTGQYTLQWEGKGTLQLIGTSVSVLSSKPQQMIYQVNTADQRGLALNLLQTDPLNPVRNISLRAPLRASKSGTFNQLYESDLANYGVIRFMGWNATNDSPVSKWSDRTKPTDFHWGTSRGVPYELQIQLSNELNEDLWINVPHQADDEYVRDLASLVKQQLSPNLRVWLEYSNETWNTQFQQSAYVRNVLQPQYGVADAPQAYGRRSAEIFDVFSSQFTDSHRLVRVIAGQSANSWVLDESLKGATVNGTIKADVAAIAPYFTIDTDDLYQQHHQGTLNLDDVFAQLRVAVDGVIKNAADNQRITAAHGLPLVSYEGGEHLVAKVGDQQNDQAFVDLLIQINRDPRMGELYTYMLDQWYGMGGRTFVFAGDVYRPDKSGAWGLQESYLDTNAAKFKAVQRYLQKLKPSPGDLNKDGSVDPQDYDFWRTLFGTTQDLYADANGDGNVDAADYVVWRREMALSTAAPGDFNKDGAIDDLDYAIWRSTFGSPTDLSADANGNGVVDAADYLIWRLATQTASAAMSGGHGVSAIPEPQAVMLAFSAIYVGFLDIRRFAAR
jgi:hypothetical protein